LLAHPQAPWPLNQVLDANSLAQYADAFSMLLRLRRAACALGLCWHALVKPAVHSTEERQFAGMFDIAGALPGDVPAARQASVLLLLLHAACALS
jgi:hypothetical protein